MVNLCRVSRLFTASVAKLTIFLDDNEIPIPRLFEWGRGASYPMFAHAFNIPTFCISSFMTVSNRKRSTRVVYRFVCMKTKTQKAPCSCIQPKSDMP